MLNERCLDLSSRQSVTGDVDYVVDTSPDPVVALVVTSGTISSELQKLEDIREPYFEYLRSSPCIHSGMCPCIACVLPRLCGPC